MGRQELGAVSPVPCGEWSSVASYTSLNVVTHNGSSYIAKLASTAIEPSVASNWTSYWMCLSQKGEKGEKGEQGLQGEKGEAGEMGATGPQGPTGAAIISVTKYSEGVDGITYKMTFDNGVTAYFTAPKGPQGVQGSPGLKATLTGTVLTIEEIVTE